MRDTTEKKSPAFQLRNCQRKIRVDCDAIAKALRKCSGLFDAPPCRIEIALISDIKIRKLNDLFLRKNTVTDVMSFRISRDSGEIIISAETAAKNGSAYGLMTEYEIIYLIIHGYLHLKNYGDYTEKERKIMFPRQNRMFNRILKKTGGTPYEHGEK